MPKCLVFVEEEEELLSDFWVPLIIPSHLLTPQIPSFFFLCLLCVRKERGKEAILTDISAPTVISPFKEGFAQEGLETKSLPEKRENPRGLGSLESKEHTAQKCHRNSASWDIFCRIDVKPTKMNKAPNYVLWSTYETSGNKTDTFKSHFHTEMTPRLTSFLLLLLRQLKLQSF